MNVIRFLQNSLLFHCIAIALLWGPSYIFIKIAGSELSPLVVVGGRLFFAAAFLLLLLTLKGGSLPQDKVFWRRVSLMAILANVFPFTLYVIAEQYVSSITGALVNGMTPIIMVLLLPLFIRSARWTVEDLCASALGFLGFSLLFTPTLWNGVFDGDTMGVLAMAVATLSFSLAMIYAKRAVPQDAPLFVVPAAQFLAGAILISPFFIAQMTYIEKLPSNAALFAVFALGVFCTASPYLLYYRILRKFGPLSLSLSTYLLPFMGMFFGHLVLGESILLSDSLSVICILFGIAISERENKTELFSNR